MFRDQIESAKYPAILFPNDGWKEEETRRQKTFKSIKNTTITTNLKKLFRLGIPCDQRSKWWMIESGGEEVRDQIGSYWSSIKQNAKQMKEQTIPFGVKLTFLETIPEMKRAKIYKFIQLVYCQNRHIDYSPILPRVCSLLLGFLKPSDAYSAVQSLINRTAEDNWYFSLSKDQFLLSANSVKDICFLRCRSLIQHFDEIKIEVAELFVAFMFTTKLPLPCLYTFFDAFLYEGKKVLIRFFLQFLYTEKSLLLRTKDCNSVLEVFSRFGEKMADINYFKKYLDGAYSISLSRNRHMLPAESIAKHRISSMPHITHNLEDLLMIPQHSHVETDIKGSQFLNKQSTIISDEDFDQIYPYLPPVLKKCPLKLVFKMTVDGTSYSSMLSSASQQSPALILIQTTERKCGAFLSDPISKKGNNGRYFGRPSTFVFELEPAIIYKKTKIEDNKLFISIDENEMMIGGPKPAIYITNGLALLQSSNCETFDSLPFANEEGDMITDLELYSFLSLYEDQK